MKNPISWLVNAWKCKIPLTDAKQLKSNLLRSRKCANAYAECTHDGRRKWERKKYRKLACGDADWSPLCGSSYSSAYYRNEQIHGAYTVCYRRANQLDTTSGSNVLLSTLSCQITNQSSNISQFNHVGLGYHFTLSLLAHFLDPTHCRSGTNQGLFHVSRHGVIWIAGSWIRFSLLHQQMKQTDHFCASCQRKVGSVHPFDDCCERVRR